MGPSFSLRSEYFYGPFSLNFSGAAFVNIYVKHKTMGNFVSLGSGIFNANTKCSLRGKRFSPVCFNWPERVWEGHIATVPSIKSLQQTGMQTVLDITGWRDQQCLRITTVEEAQQLGRADLKISVLLCVSTVNNNVSLSVPLFCPNQTWQQNKTNQSITNKINK